MKKMSGFTLIELVMVIVVLGILAVTAMPKFVDFKSDAQIAALAGVVGGITSANEVNVATRSLNALSGVATVGATCSAAAGTLLNGGLPAGYSLSVAQLIASGVNTCVVTQTNGGATASAVVTGI